MTKTKTKTKSFTKNVTSFPAAGWDYDMEYVIDLPRFFGDPRWREISLDPPPGPSDTRKELDELLEKQRKLEADELKRQRREREVKEEAGAHDSPKLCNMLMLGPTGSYRNTYMLAEAMIVLGKIVVVHFKNQFMRPRPSQLEPRLRPLIPVPGHPAYPSGHSVQMHLVAKALATVCRSHELGQQLFAIADEIAVNREWAGLHYASDTQAGKRLAFEIFPIVEDAYAETFQKAALEWR